MKLQKLLESTPDVQALWKAGIECSPREFQENFDLIIDFQDRMNALYDDLEEKLHIIRFEDDPDYDVPQIASSITVEPNVPGSQRRQIAWFFFDGTHEDYALIKKTARSYVDRAFKRYLPEIEATFKQFDEGNVNYVSLYYTLKWSKEIPKSVQNVYFSAPDTDDNNHSNKNRKALKWW